ncbi:MAG: AMP-binding protein [Polyangiaceae bacterium]|nr:AMP-binding protein [Polyangiaceae bacterium]
MPDKPIPTPDPERIDIDAVASAVRSGKASMKWLGGFLPATWDAPERFHKALHAHASKRVGGHKSRPGEGYDLYHDTIGVHVGQRRRAFVAASASGDTDITFDNLHHRSAALSIAWAQMGVAPGKSVAIVLPVSVDHVIALVACLRLGAVVSTVSPDGPTFVQNRLERLQPDHVVTSDKLARHCGDFAEKRIQFVAPAMTNTSAPSHWYASDEPVLRILSPFGDPAGDPVEVCADKLYESLIVAGLFVFALDKSDTLAAPGFSPAQFQPHLLLSAFVAGAAYAEMPASDVEADAKIVSRTGTTVLGVCRSVRDALVRQGSSNVPKGLRAWFRSLTEKFDIERWVQFQNIAWERKVPGFCIAASSAASFVHLFSPPAAPNVAALRVWPAPGASFALAEIAAGELPSLRDAGVYAPLVEGKPADPSGLPTMIFARESDGYVFAGSVDLGHDAHAYPADEVVRVVESHRAVRHAAVVVTSGKYTNDAVVALLVFTDDHRDAEGRVVFRFTPDDIRALVMREMGPTALPDRIEVFPLRPRIVEGKVDAAYCRDQYLGGLFHKKATSELHLLISRLGYILAGPRAG